MVSITYSLETLLRLRRLVVASFARFASYAHRTGGFPACEVLLRPLCFLCVSAVSLILFSVLSVLSVLSLSPLCLVGVQRHSQMTPLPPAFSFCHSWHLPVPV